MNRLMRYSTWDPLVFMTGEGLFLSKGSCQVKKIEKSEKKLGRPDETNPPPLIYIFFKHLRQVHTKKKKKKKKYMLRLDPSTHLRVFSSRIFFFNLTWYTAGSIYRQGYQVWHNIDRYMYNCISLSPETLTFCQSIALFQSGRLY